MRVNQDACDSIEEIGDGVWQSTKQTNQKVILKRDTVYLDNSDINGNNKKTNLNAYTYYAQETNCWYISLVGILRTSRPDVIEEERTSKKLYVREE